MTGSGGASSFETDLAVLLRMRLIGTLHFLLKDTVKPISKPHPEEPRSGVSKEGREYGIRLRRRLRPLLRMRARPAGALRPALAMPA
jgi:hypothetical protein